MTVLNQLATALNRRDETPNKELAEQIAKAGDKKAVEELVENLGHKDKNIQSDCIKTLYEVGERRPELIAKHYKAFGKLLESKNNRLVWGAMCALDAVAAIEPKGVRSLLPVILVAADEGSVITRDHAVGILAKLGSLKQYANECVPLLIEQLMKSPNNQFPTYAEKTLAAINEKNKERFRQILMKRMSGLATETQKKRVMKVLKTVEKGR